MKNVKYMKKFALQIVNYLLIIIMELGINANQVKFVCYRSILVIITKQ